MQRIMKHRVVIAGMVALAAAGGYVAGVNAHEGGPLGIKPLYRTDLMGVEGKDVRMYELTFPPGAVSPDHIHPGNVFGYVIEGEIVNQFDDDAPVTHRAGQVFYEKPGTRHVSSVNASKTDTARAVVFIVNTKGEADTIPVKNEE